MNNKNAALVILFILVILLAVGGIILGLAFYRSNIMDNNINKKDIKTFNLTLEDMYCNIKDSKKIVKLKVTIETSSKKTIETLEEKQFLIRDDINKIIRNKTEEELQGEEGQTQLQNKIKKSLINLFNDETIVNVYFNDLIIQ